MIKLAEMEDEPWAKDLQELLFWLKIASLSGELSVAVAKKLRESADYIARNGRFFRKLDEQVEQGQITKQNSYLIKDNIDQLAGIKAKRVERFKAFASKWSGRSIKDLESDEIVDAMVGYTEQANRIARLIKSKRMEIIISDDSKFESLLGAAGDSEDEISMTAAFNWGEENYFRASTDITNFMNEVFHEGTHTLDNPNLIDKDSIALEKRAFFHERAFQIATVQTAEFEAIEEMINFINEVY